MDHGRIQEECKSGRCFTSIPPAPKLTRCPAELLSHEQGRLRDFQWGGGQLVRRRHSDQWAPVLYDATYQGCQYYERGAHTCILGGGGAIHIQKVPITFSKGCWGSIGRAACPWTSLVPWDCHTPHEGALVMGGSRVIGLQRSRALSYRRIQDFRCGGGGHIVAGDIRTRGATLDVKKLSAVGAKSYHVYADTRILVGGKRPFRGGGGAPLPCQRAPRVDGGKCASSPPGSSYCPQEAEVQAPALHDHIPNISIPWIPSDCNICPGYAYSR